MVYPGEIYVHYKDPTHTYRIVALAKDVNTMELLVVYEMLYESHNAPKGQIWVRSLKEFESCIDGKPRFSKI